MGFLSWLGLKPQPPTTSNSWSLTGAEFFASPTSSGKSVTERSAMQGYAVARQNGWMSANDIRALENLDLIPTEDGGDLYLVNGNMLPLNQAGSYYTQREATGANEPSGQQEPTDSESKEEDDDGDNASRPEHEDTQYP